MLKERKEKTKKKFTKVREEKWSEKKNRGITNKK